MNVYIVTLVIFLFYVVLAWIAGALLHLHGASLWILRGGLILIGAAAAALFLWFHHRIKRRKTVIPFQFAGLAEQVKVLLRQTEQKLAAGNQGSLGSLPVVFILGDLNSAKTSTIVHSGLEPELIAGHVFRDSDIVPTATINVWFARKTVFIEAGGKLAANPQLWAQVLRQTRPKRISAAVGKGQLAPRAALVCLDCERLSASQTSIQSLAGRLKEMAHSIGAAFPVYVLFNKLDRFPHFAEFVSNLTAAESAQVLGATLPRSSAQGVFAEEESRRLARALDQIIYSLAEKRLEFLSRETVSQKAAGIYEFPREVRKSRNQLVQLLVELTRPTQLSANPFLRGFYFSGVRAVVINEAVSIPSIARTASAAVSGATRMFNIAEDAPASGQSGPKRTVQSRKVPEWAFLPHLFTDVILADRVAFAASHQSARVDRLRRSLLGAFAFILVFLVVTLAVSFFKNRSLESEFVVNAEHLNAISAGAAIEAPNIEQLRQLDALRGSVAKLIQYRSQGPPMSYDFGLYVGNRIYPAAGKLYFQNFRRFLLASVQARMVARLSHPPSTRTSDDFQQMYFTLKAYLITTSNHEHADWNSLLSVLLENSPASSNADAEYQDLVRRQFAFYVEELPAASPYGPENDTVAVDRARAYLKQFDAVEAVYQAMLEAAGRGNKPVNFNRRFPQSAGYVVDNYEVPAAFTKEGCAVMQKSLQNPEKFRAEEWVLGAAPTVNLLAGSLRDILTSRYAADYMKQWRVYLRSGRVVRYGGLQDASTKLAKLVANDSPLLQLLWLAKENTAVDIPDLKNPFDAVQRVARDSSLERLVGSGNQEYMNALSGLQGSVQTVVNTPNGPKDHGMLGQILQAASGASVTAKGIERNFTIDTEVGADKVDKNVARLLEEPIDYATDAAKRAMGSGAEDVCKIANAVTSKRPFNARSNEQANLQEVQDLFRPQGTLWTSLPAKVGTVQRQGSTWVNVGSAPQSQNFLNFLNRAQQFTDTLFPNGSPMIRLGYTLRRLPAVGIESASLVIDGQSLTEAGRTQQFTWQGGESSVSLNVTAAGQKLNGGVFQGPWALFEFFDSADTWTGVNPATLAWQLKVQFGRHAVGDGSKTEVQYELTTTGAQVFSKEFLSKLHCSAR